MNVENRNNQQLTHFDDILWSFRTLASNSWNGIEHGTQQTWVPLININTPVRSAEYVLSNHSKLLNNENVNQHIIKSALLAQSSIGLRTSKLETKGRIPHLDLFGCFDSSMERN